MTPIPKPPLGVLLLAFFLMAVSLSLPGCEKTEPATKTQAQTTSVGESQKVIVALGDSLTAGYGIDPDQAYPAILQRKLRDLGYSYRVVNAGLSGETSSGCLSRLNWVLRLDPAIVILETGANDGMRGIDPAVTQKNIQAIVDRLRSRNTFVILTGMRMLPNLGAQYTATFNALYPQLAKTNQLIFMPFFLKDVAGQKSLNNSDGIHPNTRGYEIIVENLWPYLKSVIDDHQGETAP